jgi:hypothetical protein
MQAIGAGAGVAGGVLAANQTNDNSQQQLENIDKARAQNKEYYNQGVGALNPYNQGGQSAFSQYNNFSGANGADAQNAAFSSFTGGPYLAQMQANAGNALNSQYAATGRSPYGGNAINALYAQNAGLWNNALNQQMGYLQQGAGMGLQAGQGIMTGAGTAMGANNQLTGMANTAIGQQVDPWAAGLSSLGKSLGGMSGGPQMFGGGGGSA